MLSSPVLRFYQISSKYFKGYSRYRADKQFNADTDANADADTKGIRPKTQMSPHPLVRGWGGGGGAKWTCQDYLINAFDIHTRIKQRQY